MASTAGSAGIGDAIMANGANIAFRKNSYLKVSEKIVDSKFASGDDAFLLSEIKNEYGKKSIIFNYSAEGEVITNAPESLIAFFIQRFRWASKSHKINDFFTSYVAFIVVTINVLILFSVFIGLFLLNKSLVFTAIIIFMLKAIVDFLLLHSFLTDFKRKKLLRNFILVQLLYPIYITIVVVVGPFVNVKWKGRKIKN
jgi:cellulose synthase/poly-beta-1,6-N-acetylglucosamine synthase-like glycosyltransferase